MRNPTASTASRSSSRSGASRFPACPPRSRRIRWRETPTVFADIAALRPWECNLTGDGEPERARRREGVVELLLVARRADRRAAASSRPTRSSPAGNASSSSATRCGVGATPRIRRSSAGRSSSTARRTSSSASRRRRCSCRPAGCCIRSLPFAPRVDIWKPIAPTAGELRTRAGITASSCDCARWTASSGRQQLATASERHGPRAGARDEDRSRSSQIVPMREIYAGQDPAATPAGAGGVGAAAADGVREPRRTCSSRGWPAEPASSPPGSRSARGRARIEPRAGRARVLTLAGGALGVAVAATAARVWRRTGRTMLRLLAEVRLNLPLLVVAIVASVVTGVVCGLFPAWQASAKTCRRSAGRRAGSIGGGRAGRARRCLVGVEMALATALLASAALLLHSFVNVMQRRSRLPGRADAHR